MYAQKWENNMLIAWKTVRAMLALYVLRQQVIRWREKFIDVALVVTCMCMRPIAIPRLWIELKNHERGAGNGHPSSSAYRNLIMYPSFGNATDAMRLLIVPSH